MPISFKTQKGLDIEPSAAFCCCYGCYGYASCMLLRLLAFLLSQSTAHQLIKSMSSEQHNNKLHPSNPIFPKINSLWPFSGTSHNQSQIHPLDVSDTVDTVGSRKAVIGGSDLTVPPTPNSRCSTQSNRSDTLNNLSFNIVSRGLHRN